MKIILLLLVLTLAFCESQKRLIEFEGGRREWLTTDQISKRCQKPTFWADVTDTPNLHIGKVPQLAPFPEKPTQQAIVSKFFPQIERESASHINATIAHLQSYGNRDYTGETGTRAALWLMVQFQNIIDALPEYRQKYLSVGSWMHRRWPQPSV